MHKTVTKNLKKHRQEQNFYSPNDKHETGKVCLLDPQTCKNEESHALLHVFVKIFDHCDPLPEKQLAGSIANENNSNGISDAFHRAMVETIPQVYKVIQKPFLSNLRALACVSLALERVPNLELCQTACWLFFIAALEWF